MEKLLDRFKEVVQPSKHRAQVLHDSVNLGSFCGTLHHNLSPCILLVFCLITFYPYFIAGPITCYLSTVTGAEQQVNENFINRFCFTTSTYSVVEYNETSQWAAARQNAMPAGVGQDRGGGHQLRHNYYQWVPYLMLLQAAFFRLPYFWWKRGGHQENGLIAKLAQHLGPEVETTLMKLKVQKVKSDETLAADESNDASKGRVLKTVQFLESGRLISPKQWENLQRKENEDKLRSKAEKQLEEVAQYICKRRGHFQLLGVQWIFCDLLAFCVVLLNFFIIDLFLGGIFMSYGISALKVAAFEEQKTSLHFPLMTKCRLNKYGVSGSIENRDILCVLSLNMYFSKMFLFLWFWYLLLMLVTLTSVIIKFLRIALLKLWASEFRMNTKGIPTRIPGRDLGRCTATFCFSDCVFFYLLARNLRPITYRGLVTEILHIIDGEQAKRTPHP